MYCPAFKKNQYIYLVIKRTSPGFYEIEECVLSFDTAIKFVRTYGNSKYLILKLKLKEVIH